MLRMQFPRHNMFQRFQKRGGATIRWGATFTAMIFFICWITSHFQKFQNAAIGKKNKRYFIEITRRARTW